MKLPQNYVPGQGVRKASGFGGLGQRMLEKQGWQQGQGLGPAKDGMREALETKEKKDSSGVGANQGWDWSAKFWEESYNSAANGIKHGAASSSSNSSSSSDNDGPDTNAGAGTRAAALKRHRRSGIAASPSSSSSDSDGGGGGRGGGGAIRRRARGGGASGGAGAKAGGAAAGGVDRVEWRGRAGKLARIAQQEAAEMARLAAALSEAGGGEGGKGKGGGGQGGGAGGGGGKAAQMATAAKAIVVTLDLPDNGSEAMHLAFKPTPRTGWWGAAYFTSAGAMGGMEEPQEREAKEAKEEARRKGFTEDDQAGLYMLAHNNQRSGKKGLGKSTALNFGSKWEGSRKTFGEEGAAAGGAGAGGEADGAEAEAEQKGGLKAGGGKGEGGEGGVGGGGGPGKEKRKKKRKRGAEGEQRARAGGGEEEGNAQEEQQQQQQHEGGGSKKRRGKAAADAGQAGQQGEGEAGGVCEGEGAGSKGSIKQAMKQVKLLLKQAPKGRLRLPKLCAQVEVQLEGAAWGHQALSQLLHKKAKKSKLLIERGYVKLVPPAAA